MSVITENESIEMTNLISYRGRVTQQQFAQISNEIQNVLDSNNAKKAGPSISATFAIDQSVQPPIIDAEILVPVDKQIIVPAGYTFKPVFRLKNAVKIRHEGNPATLQNVYTEIMQYIKDHQMSPATAAYNVTVREPQGPMDIDSLIIDVYVGVNDNIL